MLYMLCWSFLHFEIAESHLIKYGTTFNIVFLMLSVNLKWLWTRYLINVEDQKREIHINSQLWLENRNYIYYVSK